MTPKLKISDVWSYYASYLPRAECQQGDFTFQQTNFDPKGKAKDLAKRHVLAHPDHHVHVTQETVSVYSVPDHLRPAVDNQAQSSTD